ncbi:MAG: sugar phosphate isomerase/epimerase family protein [Eubacteriales bacterium]|jgi:D-psicose/D-tagatose/L-ribulose 3-epimerase|nr:sugar phosphate isomerase/epimerase [Clostridiales bacterium]
MRIGACVGMNPDAIRILKKLGFDYVETHLWEPYGAVTSGDQAKIDAYLAVLDETGLKCEVSAYAFPGQYNPAGEQTRDDLERAREEFYDVISRTRFMGNEILVIGGGGARNYPTDRGYDVKNVYEQLAVICAEVISPVAAEFGLVAALEGLQKPESPTLNLTEQSVEVARASGKDNIKVMVDYFHVAVEGEDMTKFAEFGDFIVHTHIANPSGRVMPAQGDGADYPAFFTNLARAGYNSRLSLEARVQGEFEPTMREALAEMRRQVQAAGL